MTIFSTSIEPSSKCFLTLSKLTVKFRPTNEVKSNTKTEPPVTIQEELKEAVERVQKRDITDPVQYRKELQKEIARIKAIERAKLSIKRDLENGSFKLPDALSEQAEQEKQRKLDKEIIKRTFNELKSAEKETVLFVDTPVTGIDGKPLNTVVTLVVDHHGPYAPANGLDNSGAQIIKRLVEASEKKENKNPDGSINIDKALKSFQETLFGRDPGKVILSTDNLADGAEVLALLKNETLQKRILGNPELAKKLIESGRFTDFFVFGGDSYETTNLNPQSQEAIQLSKAIMQSHSDLLKEYKIPFGDRVVGLKDPNQQKELLNKAVDQAEEILLIATEPKGDLTKVKELADRFDKSREISISEANKMHEAFKKQLTEDIGGNTPSEKAVLEKTINAYLYGHKPISTGNQFADWGGSPIANNRQTDPKPIKFEIGGTSSEDVGKAVILAKSGKTPVDLRPLAEALNAKAKEKKRDKLERENKNKIEIEETLATYSEFTPRGTDLVFSFGGHSLSRSEISQIVANTLKGQGGQIVPGYYPK